MNYTLHLTNTCNLNCAYCFQEKKGGSLSFDNIKMLLDREADTSTKSVITFFGGEPLLEKNLIYKIVEYTKILQETKKMQFTLNMTTNGTLLDADFIGFVDKNSINISYSIDGKCDSHNLNRKTIKNEDTFTIVETNAKKLLEIQPYAIAMPVVTKNNILNIKNNIRYIFSLGFKRIVCGFDYTADWQDEDVNTIKKAYEELAELYYNKTLNGDAFYLLPFDNIISAYISESNLCESECQLGLKKVNVATDGKIYPCTQFVDLPEYEIGDCATGIMKEKQSNLMKNSSKEISHCLPCKLRKRCKHTCGCLNILTTGDMNTPSPIICETEKIFIEVSDRLAERLFKKDPNVFIQKQYLAFYS